IINVLKIKFQRGSRKMKMIFLTPNRGWSMRTVESLVRGEYFLSFTGVLRTVREAVESNQDMDMNFDISPAAHLSFFIVKLLFIDFQANEFKYINHSCNPRAHLHGVSSFTRQNIDAYSEITFDYYKPGDKFRFDCMCGGYACRGIKGVI
ncbi:hypothetical protein PFISCL1PPCAC_5141, partial [Pristionchus fissidentatus]